jgi:hypothetical protein
MICSCHRLLFSKVSHCTHDGLIDVVGMNNEQALDLEIACEDTVMLIGFSSLLLLRKVAGFLLPEERFVHQSVMSVYLLGSTPGHRPREIPPGRDLQVVNPSRSGPDRIC